MRIIDENGNELTEVNEHAGYGVEEELVIAHHEAQEMVPEQAHYEVLRTYPNGGQDVRKIVDVPFQPYIPAWDETETILRWHWYAKGDSRLVNEMIAQDNIIAGDYFYANGSLFLATTTIPKGTAIKKNVNCFETSVEEALSQQEASDEKTDI